MKKMKIFCLLLLLTGCKNKLQCTLETDEEMYISNQKIIFEFKNDKVSDVTLNYEMIFEDEKTAKDYFVMFEALDEQYEITQEKNKIGIISKKNYEQYDQNKNELKEELETNGYSCK